MERAAGLFQTKSEQLKLALHRVTEYKADLGRLSAALVLLDARLEHLDRASDVQDNDNQNKDNKDNEGRDGGHDDRPAPHQDEEQGGRLPEEGVDASQGKRLAEGLFGQFQSLRGFGAPPPPDDHEEQAGEGPSGDGGRVQNQGQGKGKKPRRRNYHPRAERRVEVEDCGRADVS
ncbi:hypothetical protein ColTof4_14443 [Colletotrichum tofieldiae]|nr:hypothetical protein ColTof3_14835 [Colletotrichum tofieldiae]GKT82020.1 hypothetical protein ColTof4_14443 [Colletotrichum tofieldiae]